MSKKLKPCPFCGSKAVLTHIPPDGTPYRIGDDGLYIVCCYDDECGDGKSGSNLDNVIKEWNTRPLEDAANARAEAAEASAEKLQTALEEEGHRNAVFTACLHKAQDLYLKAHPDYPGWPDGAVNITWVLEAFDKERAEVKRLQTALDAANEDAAFHPRAAKLMRKRKNFIVIACDESYFMDVYDLIRDSEMQKGTWTIEDQWHYDDAKVAHRARVGGLEK